MFNTNINYKSYLYRKTFSVWFYFTWGLNRFTRQTHFFLIEVTLTSMILWHYSPRQRTLPKFNPLPHNADFEFPVERNVSLKTLSWEKEKMLATSIFSFSHNVFLLLNDKRNFYLKRPNSWISIVISLTKRQLIQQLYLVIVTWLAWWRFTLLSAFFQSCCRDNTGLFMFDLRLHVGYMTLYSQKHVYTNRSEGH